jgi:hypothetical protein
VTPLTYRRLSPPDRKIVRDAAACMGRVSAMQQERRGKRNGAHYDGPTADAIISARVADWRRQVRLLDATIEYAIAEGLYTPYTGRRIWRRRRGA